MDTLRVRASHAAALHRQAAAITAAAAAVLDATRPVPADQREQHELAERLRAAASLLAPGWLGAPLDAQSEDAPLGGPGLPAFVRIGTAQPLDDARFPAVVPLLGTGHLTVDADSHDPRVAGLLRSVLVRLLAAAPAGSLLVRAVDAASAGQVFAPFAPLADAGLMPPPVTDRTGLRAVLAEAEHWVRPARPAAARHNRHDRTLLLVIGSLPELTEGADLARIGALAEQGPEAGLHLLIAGWPPPPLTAETTQPPMPRTTMIALRNPYALVGDPPGGSFGHPAPHLPSTGLNCPVFLDGTPPLSLLGRVCRELAARFGADSSRTLDELLPDPADGLWAETAADDLTTTVGHDGDRAVTLRFNDLTPHWLVGGRPGAGGTAFLVNVLYGLCTRYHPDELALYLLDFAEGTSFTEFVPAVGDATPTIGELEPTGRDRPWLPHVRAVGVQADREYGLAVLRELDAELDRRASAGQQTAAAGLAGPSTVAGPAGVTGPAGITGPAGAAGLAGGVEPPERLRLPRILCVLNEFPVLLAGGDPVAAEALSRLESVARRGRSYGVHLILSSRPAPALEPLRTRRDSVFGQFPVRVALPGGADILEPANDAAAGLPLGTAVVNTAGGLGGPRGATRGHERVVRFPDPHTDDGTLAALRHRLWAARPAGAAAPAVFAGFLPARLSDDPTYRAALAGHDTPPALAGHDTPPALAGRSIPAARSGGHDSWPAALVGRVVDVPRSTAAVPLDPSPGRHLAVLGPSPAGSDVLDAAARGLAAQHAPGTARFVVASLVDDGHPAADALSAELAERHAVDRVDADGLARSLDLTRPGYLVVFGMDGIGAGELPAGRLRTLLRDGPARGVHLISWWRAARRFAHAVAVGPDAGRDAGSDARRDADPDARRADPDTDPDATTGATVDGLVFLDVPAPEVALVLGRAVDWRPRPDRALLYDRRTDRTRVIVPFARHPRKSTP